MHRSLLRTTASVASLLVIAAASLQEPAATTQVAPSTSSVAPLDPQPGTAAPPATSPSANWFGQPGGITALYPNLRVDAEIRAGTPRTVFNAMLTPGRPPVQMTPMYVTGNVFTETSWSRFQREKNPWNLVIDERRCRMAAVDAQQRGAALCLDIESFPLDARFHTDADIARSIRIIARIVGYARAQVPQLRIFLYSMTPHTDTYLALEYHVAATTQPGGAAYGEWSAKQAELEPRRASWFRANARLRKADANAVSLAELFDGVCPSLYLPGRADGWRADEVAGVVRGHLDEARKYGKPVYPFVWPRFYQSPDAIDLTTWLVLMREITQNADGMILWEESRSMWSFAATLRVRIANLLAARAGDMTNRELYDALKKDFNGYPELDLLLTEPVPPKPLE